MTALLLLAALGADPLSDATKRYGDLDYEGCVSVLAPAVGRYRGAPRAKLELYLGLCHFALGREGDARRHLDIALRLDANLALPASASPKERQLFEDVARSVAANPRPKRPSPKKPSEPDEAPEPEPEPEPEPPAVEPAPVPAPAAAIVAPPAPPPPPRTFTAAVTFTALTVVAAGLAAGFGLGARDLEAQGTREPVQVRAGELSARGNTFALVTNIAWAATGGFGVAALIAWLWSGLSSQ